MYDTVRESFVGEVLYHASRGRIFSYPEERPDFVIPERYRARDKATDGRGALAGPGAQEKSAKDGQGRRGAADDERRASGGRASASSQDTVVEGGLEEDNVRAEQRRADDDEDPNLVTWYGPDDPENPQNWSLGKKCWVVVCIMLITTSVYMGSSIYSPAIEDAVAYFGLGQVTVTLGLSLFVAGYGIGPLFLSPISEIPQVGRTLPYIITLAVFCVLQVPTALVTNFAGFAILRFIAGFVGSPPLATGGASLADVFAPHKLPYAMGLYGVSAASGPAIAPIIAGFAVESKGWRWAFWEMLWLSGFSLVLLSFTLPETSSTNILVRRARRLRKLTGNDKLRSEGEIQSEQMTSNEIVQMTLVRPFSMTFTEPIILAIDLYIGLVYAILYSFFESFPIVYTDGYGWSLGISELPFIALFIGSLVSYAIYCLWNRFYFEKTFIEAGGQLKPETRLPMSMLGAFCFPVCLFWFAWTANRTHWISPVIASAFFGVGATWMFMPFLTYLPHAYPKYAASVLASNDFVRAMMGAGMPLAAHGLFVNLGVDWGNSLLGFLTVAFIPIPFLLYKFGPWLRDRSPRALHDKDIEDADEGETVA
ncbi:GTPase-activating protein [Cryptotrichosporon argae]